MIGETLLAFGTLFPIVNPFSTAIIFNSLTKKKTVKKKRHIAAVASVTACVLLLFFLMIGTPMMKFFGITLYAFRIAGGLYLGKVAFDMLSKKYRHPLDVYKDTDEKDIAIIPLAIPLLSGPGAITSVFVMIDTYVIPAIVLSIVLVCLASYIVLRYADYISRVLGHIGTSVIERVLGLLVLVIAVQFFFNGITGYLAAINIF